MYIYNIDTLANVAFRPIARSCGHAPSSTKHIRENKKNRGEENIEVNGHILRSRLNSI